MARIVVADDHIVLREGVKSLLDSVEGWEVVAQASNGFEVLSHVEAYQPDILVLDLSMPTLGGIETLSRLKKHSSTTSVLVLSAREDDISVREAIGAGAKAYVPKTADADELIFAIKAVLKGQAYLSPSICGSVVGDPNSGGESPLAVLSSREREVMKLLAEGRPNREVAKLLHISPRTIDSHRSNIMKKLSVSSNAELVQLALRYGLLE